MLSLILAVTTTAVGSLQWALPSGWESLPPPPDQGIAYVYLPLHRDGQNIGVTIEEIPTGSSLENEAQKLARTEADDGRTIEATTPHATCDGKLPGVDVQAHFGNLASQLYHVTVDNGKLYVFIYTYAPGAKVATNVAEAIDSLCAAVAPA